MASGKEKQVDYYNEIAATYDERFISKGDEHSWAFEHMVSAIGRLAVESLLDVGAGTGRTLKQVKDRLPEVSVIGIEPVRALREVGYEKGLSESQLINGNGYELPFSDNSFDLVCAYGVLHHVKQPELVVSEMLRVASKAIFVSDNNGFGQGRYAVRVVKQLLNSLRLWPVVNFLKTKGRGYIETPGDGISYSYSLFNNLRQIEKHCRHVVYYPNDKPPGQLYKEAGHLAILGEVIDG